MSVARLPVTKARGLGSAFLLIESTDVSRPLPAVPARADRG